MLSESIVRKILIDRLKITDDLIIKLSPELYLIKVQNLSCDDIHDAFNLYSFKFDLNFMDSLVHIVKPDSYSIL